ncbi:AAA family ATPase [Pararhizobium haloflavum]|uniref:AAA family ATPase n=1 Tax=Pararhizobium haloflavum TaxID=2037914 RepID=UPI001FE0E64A|nr:AAA family ATPase [Pararhizobium haloflavum]
MSAVPLIVLSGCSGGGKSTLLDALSRRGYAVVPEAGRQIVREELAEGGTALPWRDVEAFIDRLVQRSINAYREVPRGSGPVFFDRGLVDALSHAEYTGWGRADELETSIRQYPYHRNVFMTPPWPALYDNEPERNKSFEMAIAEYEQLRRTYARLGYRLVDLPLRSVDDRVAFIESHVARA